MEHNHSGAPIITQGHLRLRHGKNPRINQDILGSLRDRQNALSHNIFQRYHTGGQTLGVKVPSLTGKACHLLKKQRRENQGPTDSWFPHRNIGALWGGFQGVLSSAILRPHDALGGGRHFGAQKNLPAPSRPTEATGTVRVHTK